LAKGENIQPLAFLATLAVNDWRSSSSLKGQVSPDARHLNAKKVAASRYFVAHSETPSGNVVFDFVEHVV
jgi:hypothetical protein